MANTMTQKMAAADVGTAANPRKGERFRCQHCSMEIEVTSDCHCGEGEHAHFECCGAEMVKA